MTSSNRFDGKVAFLTGGGSGIGRATVVRFAAEGRTSFAINPYLHSLGIYATAHSLRHWCATTALAATHDLRSVQDLLGHASPATTALHQSRREPAGAERQGNHMRIEANRVARGRPPIAEAVRVPAGLTTLPALAGGAVARTAEATALATTVSSWTTGSRPRSPATATQP